MFGCERFHTYVYGKHFTVESDHKLLIQHQALIAAQPRLQCMLLSLQPSRNKGHIKLNLQLNIVQITEQPLNNICEETAKDLILCELKEVIVHGWLDKVKEFPNQLRPHWSIRDELAVKDGIILKGECVIIPKTIQEHLLS